MKQYKIYNEDCLKGMKKIKDESVDLILTDPPYGTIKGLVSEDWDLDKTKWDVCIDNEKLFKEYARILKFNGRIILFSQEPYTKNLRNFNEVTEIKFNYPMIWKKNNFGNPLNAKHAPLSYFEDINVFTKVNSVKSYIELRNYFKKLKNEFNLNKNKVAEILGHNRGKACMSTDTKTVFNLCSESTYNDLIVNFGIDKWEDFKSYSELRKLKESYLRTFNLPAGKSHVPNVLEFKKDTKSFHPTQKPVELLEYLIKVYSNEGETILDSCMGSGSTGVAALNINRKFIGYELDKDFYDIAKKRIESVGIKTE